MCSYFFPFSGDATKTLVVVCILVADCTITLYCTLMQLLVGDALCVESNFYKYSSLMKSTL